jgi:hypothetical protein
MTIMVETRSDYNADLIRQRCIDRFSGAAVAEALSGIYGRAHAAARAA